MSPVDGYSNTAGVTTARLFYHSLHSLKPPQTPIKELRGAVGSIISNDKVGMIALEQNKVAEEKMNRQRRIYNCRYFSAQIAMSRGASLTDP